MFKLKPIPIATLYVHTIFYFKTALPNPLGVSARLLGVLALLGVVHTLFVLRACVPFALTVFASFFGRGKETKEVHLFGIAAAGCTLL